MYRHLSRRCSTCRAWGRPRGGPPSWTASQRSWRRAAPPPSTTTTSSSLKRSCSSWVGGKELVNFLLVAGGWMDIDTFGFSSPLFLDITLYFTPPSWAVIYFFLPFFAFNCQYIVVSSAFLCPFIFPLIQRFSSPSPWKRSKRGAGVTKLILSTKEVTQLYPSCDKEAIFFLWMLKEWLEETGAGMGI